MVVGTLRQETQVVVIGGGPGGYVAAIRAADLGKDVILVEERARPGGVCLIEGCIPSKTLIHAVQLADEVKAATTFGLTVEGVRLDHKRLRDYKNEVVAGLTGGVETLLKKRGVEVVR